jgi:hypothetical protein
MKQRLENETKAETMPGCPCRDSAMLRWRLGQSTQLISLVHCTPFVVPVVATRDTTTIVVLGLMVPLGRVLCVRKEG